MTDLPFNTRFAVPQRAAEPPKPNRFSPIRSLDDPRIRKEPGGCWAWTGGRNSNGVPVAKSIDGREERVARRLFAIAAASEIDGYTLHSTCGTQNCVNPDHHDIRPSWKSGPNPRFAQT